jgi:hypothetical protein
MFNQLKSSLSKVGKTNSAIALAVFALLLPACDTGANDEAVYDEPIGEEQVGNPGTVEEGETIEEIEENPQAMVGEQVDITGQVVNVYDANTFSVEDDDFLGGERVLVVNPAGSANMVLGEDDQVQVMGEVQQVTFADLERDYGLTWDADIQRELEAEYQTEPVVVAQTITILDPEM